MTPFRDEIRDHFERQALRYPAPGGLRVVVVKEAEARAGERRRRQWVPTAVAALVAVAIVAAFLVSGTLLRSLPSGPPSTPRLQVSPPSLHVATTLMVGPNPASISVGAGSVWVGHLGNLLVSRIDPSSNRVLDLYIASASGMAADDSAIWVTDELNNTLQRIDPKTNRVVATIGVGQSPHGVAIGDGAVWVANLGGSISRVDPTSNQVVATIGLPSGAFVQRVAFGYGSVWVPSGDGRLFRIDPKTNRIGATVSIPGFALDATVSEGAVWVDINPELAGGTGPGSVVRVDPASNRVVATISVGRNPNGVAAGGGAVFVVNQDDGTLSEIDPRTNSVMGRPLGVGKGPAGVAVGATAAWVANNGDGTVVRIEFSR
jgi:YVTN family beta-propeller protein